MAYEKQNFLDGQIVTADHLNHIENGIIAAQNPRNLLDNSDFTNPVNQRGASKYTGSVYTIDRWRSWNNEFSMTINNGNLSWSGGSIVQYFDTVLTGVHTLAVMGSNGTLYLYSADMSQSFSYSTVLGMGTDNAGNSAVSIGDGTYIWAALYEGSYTADTLPPYVPKGYGAELTECRRYYRNREYLNCAKTYNDYFSISKSIEMRAIPTVEYISFAPYGAATITDFSNCSMEISKTSTGVQRITWVKLPTCSAYNAGGLAVNLYADI